MKREISALQSALMEPTSAEFQSTWRAGSEALVYPQHSQRFKSFFEELMSQPVWASSPTSPSKSAAYNMPVTMSRLCSVTAVVHRPFHELDVSGTRRTGVPGWGPACVLGVCINRDVSIKGTERQVTDCGEHKQWQLMQKITMLFWKYCPYW